MSTRRTIEISPFKRQEVVLGTSRAIGTVATATVKPELENAAAVLERGNLGFPRDTVVTIGARDQSKQVESCTVLDIAAGNATGDIEKKRIAAAAKTLVEACGGVVHSITCLQAPEHS